MLDRAAWIAACRPVGFLEASKPAAGWAPSTRRRVERGYGRYLGWLQLTGRLDQEAGPAARLTAANFEAFLAHLRPINAARSVITVVDSLVLFTRALGIDSDVELLRAMQRCLWHEVQDGRNKVQRLRHVAELFNLGLTLMQTADQADARLPHAVRFRDGLMIAFLSRRPLRVSNFVGLVIGEHLVQQGGVWWITLGAHETKNRATARDSFSDCARPLPRALPD